MRCKPECFLPERPGHRSEGTQLEHGCLATPNSTPCLNADWHIQVCVVNSLPTSMCAPKACSYPCHGTHLTKTNPLWGTLPCSCGLPRLALAGQRVPRSLVRVAFGYANASRRWSALRRGSSATTCSSRRWFPATGDPAPIVDCMRIAMLGAAHRKTESNNFESGTPNNRRGDELKNAGTGGDANGGGKVETRPS